jgi:hypothetical protein
MGNLTVLTGDAGQRREGFSGLFFCGANTGRARPLH